MSVTTTTPLERDAEQAAADAAESLAPASAELLALLASYRAEVAVRDAAAARVKTLRDTIGAHIVEGGVVGFTAAAGTVVARLSLRTTRGLDAAAIRRDHPALAAEYGTTKTTEVITVV